MIAKDLFVTSVAIIAFFSFFVAPPLATGVPSQVANLNFTQGDKIPAGANHDWTLGATGTRGWMFSNKLVTMDALQIAITQVAKDSPADGILAVGDVILGVGGAP